MTDQEGRGILVAAADLGDVRELEVAPARHDRRVGDLLEIVVGAVETHEDLRPPGVDRSRRCDGVLALQGGEDGLCADAEGHQARVGELDEDPFRPLAQDVDLLDAGDLQQALADRLGLPDEQARRHAGCLQRIKREGDVRVFVVDEGAKGARRQVTGLVTQLLACLVELLGNFVRWRVILQRELHEGEAGPRDGLDAVVPAQLLQALLKRLGDEILHLLGGRTRPGRRDGQDLDREGRVLGASELKEGVGSRDRDGEDQEQGDGALAHRQGREIEAGHRAATIGSAPRTRSPSWSRCAPRATMRAPE